MHRRPAFSPTPQARDNLLREGIGPGRIHVTGNPVIDALLDAVAILDADPARTAALDAALPRFDPARRLVLVTGHRRENFDGGLERVARGLVRLAKRGGCRDRLSGAPQSGGAAGRE